MLSTRGFQYPRKSFSASSITWTPRANATVIQAIPHCLAAKGYRSSVVIPVHPTMTDSSKEVDGAA
jgi:hypothetical protein